MSTWKRMMIAGRIILLVGIVGIIFYRVFLPHLYPLVNKYDGPFTGPVDTMRVMVPTLLLVIIFAMLVWAAIGGLQEERKRDVDVRRRR